MINKKVIICGICKDVAESLPVTARIVEAMGNMFEDYRVLLYENDSTDNTKSILAGWTSSNPKITLKCESVGNIPYINVDPLKSSGTSRARNIVLDMLETIPEEYTYIIWLDMDFNVEPEYSALVEIFDRENEWDAVFSYGVDLIYSYWDWLAMRDHHAPFGPEVIGHHNWYVAKKTLIHILTIKNRVPDTKWHPVISAFGGCGIYRREAIQGCRYSAEVTADLEQITKEFIEGNPDHPVVVQYKESTKGLIECHHIPEAVQGLPKHMDYHNTGITISDVPDRVTWRMSSFTYQYPVTCDHVPFHASMAVRGYNRLFINPRFLFYYAEVMNWFV